MFCKNNGIVKEFYVETFGVRTCDVYHITWIMRASFNAAVKCVLFWDLDVPHDTWQSPTRT